jgi:uncharacterized damage-inducible protein DinB
MNEVRRIADELDRGYGGDPWHGFPLARLLEGVSWRTAARRPARDVHSIWEIVLHITAWMEEVGRRLGGALPGEPAAGDWPPVGEASSESWARAKAEMQRAHEALLRGLAPFDEDRLWSLVGSAKRNPAAGSGTTFYVMLHGLAQHNAYHAGQIAVLLKCRQGEDAADRDLPGR